MVDVPADDQALSTLHEVLRKRPELPRAHLQLGAMYVISGDLEAGVAELREATSLSHRNPHFLAYLGYADAVEGQKNEAEQILKELDDLSQRDFVSPFDIAGIEAGLGRRQAALASLEHAYKARDPQLTRLLADDRMKNLRAEPAFRDLVRRVGPAR